MTSGRIRVRGALQRCRVSVPLVYETAPAALFCPQALEFKICKMRPSATSLVCGERWSAEAGRRFASLVNGRALLVRVFSVVHGVLHVDVYRCAGAPAAISVRDTLIREGHAELAEEPYESRVRTSVLVGAHVAVCV